MDRQRWEAERDAVLQLRDALGRPLDAGVVDTVIALRLAGFATAASCWGHASRACNGPWVHVMPSRDETFDELHVRVKDLLSEFEAAGRKVADHRRLIASSLLHHESHLPVVVRIQGRATRETTIGERPRDPRELIAARRRMTALTSFLRSLCRPHPGQTDTTA